MFEVLEQKINVFSNLAPIIISYLSVPISGAEVERSFSHLNNVLTDRRSLKVENLRDLLMLNFNSIFSKSTNEVTLSDDE